jgi:hypothetical protein
MHASPSPDAGTVEDGGDFTDEPSNKPPGRSQPVGQRVVLSDRPNDDDPKSAVPSRSRRDCLALRILARYNTAENSDRSVKALQPELWSVLLVAPGRRLYPRRRRSQARAAAFSPMNPATCLKERRNLLENAWFRQIIPMTMIPASRYPADDGTPARRVTGAARHRSPNPPDRCFRNARGDRAPGFRY